jgi:hypothetical protein
MTEEETISASESRSFFLFLASRHEGQTKSPALKAVAKRPDAAAGKKIAAPECRKHLRINAPAATPFLFPKKSSPKI